MLQQLQRPTLAFVLGDHQPPVPASVAPERVANVPVHVLSNRSELLVPLLEHGLRRGLAPAREQSAFASADFLRRFAAHGRRG